MDTSLQGSRSGAESETDEPQPRPTTPSLEEDNNEEPRVELGDSTASEAGRQEDEEVEEEDTLAASTSRAPEDKEQGQTVPEEVEDIPFADEDQDNQSEQDAGGQGQPESPGVEESSNKVEEGNVSDSQSPNEAEAGSSSVVGKLEVNLHS